MATSKKAKNSTTRTLLVYLGDTGLEVGELQFSRQVDFTRFNRHLLRSKLNWRVRNEESAIPG